MKKYFFKYIPFEGEKIYVGEKYINKVFKLSEYYKKDGSHYGGYPTCGEYLVETRKKNQDNDDAFSGNKYANETYVKVKLCLCTRDFKIGDEITNIETGKKRTLTTQAELSLAIMQQGVLVKVIKPIHHLNTWVTEGMEFDKSDLQLGYKKNWDVLEGDLDDPYYLERERSFVRVKCPHCKIFH
jgi:hypothetical protein